MQHILNQQQLKTKDLKNVLNHCNLTLFLTVDSISLQAGSSLIGEIHTSITPAQKLYKSCKC